MFIFERFMSAVLALVMVVGMLPAGVFAAEMETQPEEVTLQETEQTVFETAETEPTAPAVTEAIPETEAAEETLPAETEETLPAATEETVPEEGEILFVDAIGADSHELYTGYLNRLFFDDCRSCGRSSQARETLSDADKYLYDQAITVIREVADGQRTIAIAEVPFRDSGFTGEEVDLDAVLEALIHDCPYEMYWYNGCYTRITSAAVTLWFQVHTNYQAEGYAPLNPVLNTDHVKRAAAAAANARAIVDTNAWKDDFDKLAVYADEICALVTYDNAAANSGVTADTGIDPWTLVNVFDGDPETNVVCEGYAESFQYLCDLSVFDGDIACYSPTGADHKWNIVRLDGKSYLMDLTMGDDGDHMNRKKFFLAGAKGSIDKGYKIGGFHYWYYPTTTALWGTGEDSILKLSEKSYNPSTEPESDTISQDKFELFLKKCSGSFELTQKLTLTRDLEIAGIKLTLGKGGKITVSSGVTLIIDENSSLIQTEAGQVVVEKGGKLIVFGPAEGTITGEGDFLLVQLQDGELTVAGQGTIADGDLDRVAGEATSLWVMDGITGIGADAFDGCTGLEEVALPESIKTLGSRAFSGCTGMETVTFYGDAPEMEEPAGVFSGAHATLHYPLGNDTWTDEVRSGFGSDMSWQTHDANLVATGTCGADLTWMLTKNGTLTISGSGAMDDFAPWSPWHSYKDTITKAVVGDGVTGIGDYAFYECKSMQSIGLHDGITAIGTSTFEGCEALESVHIPAGLTRIEDNTFAVCKSLTGITLPSGLEEIGKLAFSACESLDSIVIPDKVTVIGANAFGFCTNAETLVLGKSVREIRYAAFNSCSALTSVEIPNTVEILGEAAFANCTGLKSIEIPGSVEELGSGAFSVCSGLEIVMIHEGVRSIGSNAFTCAKTLHSVTLPNSLEEIGEQAFSSCWKLEEIVIPQNVESIGKHAFDWSTALKKVTFMGKAPVIDEEAFGDFATPQTGVKATVYYPCDRSWTEDKLQDYGGKLKWIMDPALGGHNLVMDAAVEPGCVLSGLTEGSHCADCGEVVVAQEMIPATRHNFVSGTCLNCGREDKGDYTLVSGKSMKLQEIDPDTGKAYGPKEITWALDEGDEAYAILTADGKLSAPSDYEKARITAVATITKSKGQIIRTVDIYPAVTQLEVMRNGETVNGKTVNMDFTDESLVLTAEAFPFDTLENVTWTVSDKKGQYATYADNGDTLTISNPTGKAGAVTIKAAIDAGTKKNVTVKVQFASFAKTLEIAEPEKTTLKSGEKLELTAAITEPNSVTKPGIVWTTSNKSAATVSNGKVTAKNVAHPTYVTITATSKDGMASDSLELKILPKNEGQLVIMAGDTFVTNGTKAMDKGESIPLTAAVITEGLPVAVEADWISSKDAVASVDGTGLVTANGNGAAKITVQYEGMKALVNVKVSTLAKTVGITTKDGKNITEEEGENIVLLTSGKNVALVANVLPLGAAKAVTWEILEGGQYAKISNGKITANKDLTSPRYVTVRATAQDGSGVSGTIRVKILPMAIGIQLYREGMAVRTGSTYIHDLMVGDTIRLSAKVYPAKANQAVELTSSNKKIADFVDGQLVCFAPGTVTITAKALDGSNKKVSFKLTIVKRITDLSVKEGSDLTVVGGKSLKLAPMVQINPSDATNKKLTWSVAPNAYGIKINASGVLSTKKVTAPVTVNVMVTTQDGSGCMLSFNVTVTP